MAVLRCEACDIPPPTGELRYLVSIFTVFGTRMWKGKNVVFARSASCEGINAEFMLMRRADAVWGVFGISARNV